MCYVTIKHLKGMAFLDVCEHFCFFLIECFLSTVVLNNSRETSLAQYKGICVVYICFMGSIFCRVIIMEVSCKLVANASMGEVTGGVRLGLTPKRA